MVIELEFLQIDNATHHYAGAQAPALDQVSLNVGRNEFFTLLGPSGCGKTTMLRVLAGFEVPGAGRVVLDGMDILKMPPWKRPVNTVFQNYSLFPHLSVLRNVTFGLKMCNVPKRDRHGLAKDALALVQLDHLKDRMPSELSGGQQQRVALARALANKPRLLLLDEPLSALDYKLRKEMQNELKRIQRETGTTFVFVTHDQEEALAMSDRIGVMSNGKLEQVGTPEDIYDRPRTAFVASFIGDSNLLKAAPEGGQLYLQNGTPLSINHDEACTVMIRPEALELREDGPVQGTIDALTYSGAVTRMQVQAGENMPPIQVLSASASARDLTVGGTVRLGFNPSQLWIVPQ